MTIYVFVGPSIPVDDARQVLDAVYLPPVKMGDVLRAAQKKPAAIAIIDGFFENTAAVWHKEILYALSQGIPVYGAASLGALRAAELHAFGMVGVGKIFEQFRDGVLEDDDEVTVVHAPGEAGCAMFSEAMANIRCALAEAQRRGIVGAETCALLIREAKDTYYPERSWTALYRAAQRHQVPDAEVRALQRFVDTERPNQKRDDAIALLQTLAEGIAPPQGVDAWQFEQTVYWDTVQTYYGTASAGATGATDTTFERLRNHVLLVGPDRTQLRQQALLLGLVEAEARRLRMDVKDMRAALARFRYQRGLQNADAFRAWMREQQLSQEQCLELARLEMLLAVIGRRYADVIDTRLPQVLRLRGDYASALEAASSKWQRVAELGIDQLTEDDVGSFEEVFDWYQKRFGRVAGQLDEHAADLGFGGERQFLNELFAEFLVTQRLDAHAC